MEVNDEDDQTPCEYAGFLEGKLDALRMQGYTASGFIRAVLERELKQTTLRWKGR